MHLVLPGIRDFAAKRIVHILIINAEDVNDWDPREFTAGQPLIFKETHCHLSRTALIAMLQSQLQVTATINQMQLINNLISIRILITFQIFIHTLMTI